jgi:hypothetical protein
MAKQSGLGDGLLVGGYLLSGDIQQVNNIASPRGTFDFTGIDKSAMERGYGNKDGVIDMTTFFNTAAGQAHPVLKALPRTDVHVMYLRGTTLGNPAACLVSKLPNYDGSRATDGGFLFNVNAVGNAYGLDWAQQLTPGVEDSTGSLTGATADFEGGIGTWAAQADCTVAATAAQAHGGTGSLEITSTGVNNAIAEHHATPTSGIAVTAGRAYMTQAWFRAATAARTCELLIDWYTSGGVLVSTSTGDSAADTTSGWTLLSATDTAPATAAFAVIVAQVDAPAGAGEIHYVDDVQFIAQPASIDTTASASFGGQAYMQVTAFTGTDVTLKIQDSADDASWADVASFGFTQVTAAPDTERIALANTATIRRYVRVVAVTAGGFTALSYVVAMNKNSAAGVTF